MLTSIFRYMRIIYQYFLVGSSTEPTLLALCIIFSQRLSVGIDVLVRRWRTLREKCGVIFEFPDKRKGWHGGDMPTFPLGRELHLCRWTTLVFTNKCV